MNWRQVKEIALREFRTRARTRGFKVITAILLLLAIAGPIIMALLPESSDDLEEAVIGIHDATATRFEPALAAIGDELYDLTFVDLTDRSTDDVDTLLRDGEIDVAIEANATLAWEQSEDPSLKNLINAAINQVSALERGEELGVDTAGLVELFTPVEVTDRFADGEDDVEGIRRGIAFFGVFAAFLLPQFFGQLTLLSIVEEKQSRIVEVLLSHIRPAALLAGKVLGLCALALVQLTLLIAGLVGAMLVTNVVDIPASVWRFVPILAISLIGGLAIYTTLFALLGSLISRQEDAAQIMMPVFVPLMAGYIVGQIASFGDADTLIARILTWFPLTTPMLLPVRVARDAIGLPEVLISLASLALGVFLLMKLAARVYEFTLLRTGSRVGWAELIRLSRTTE